MAKLIRGRYEPIEVVGRGGQGEVFKALDHQHDRHVALKVRTLATGEDKQSLLAEARILLNLTPHRGLPLVREDFFVGRRYYMVMEWVEGESLDRLLAERGDPGLPPSSVLPDLAHVADALDHLHAHDPPIVHQDVKPANLIRTPDRRVVLVDFGISSSRAQSARRMGTRGYADPACIAGAPPDPASDVYSLAVTAWVLLTGSLPEGSNPSWQGMPKAGVGVIRRALSTDPSRRHGSAGEFIEDLKASLEGTLSEKPRRQRGPADTPASTKAGRAQPIRLVLADDHPVWRQAMRAVLERDDLAVVVAEAQDGGEAVELAATARPDVIVMDLHMPVLGGVEATQKIIAENPNAKVLILSSSDEEPDVIEAVKAGAGGYLLKIASASEVADAVRRVHGGEPAFTPSLAGLVLGEFRRLSSGRAAEEKPSLTPDERRVLKLVADGHSFSDIGAKQGVEESAVRREVQHVLAKLQRLGMAEGGAKPGAAKTPKRGKK